MVLVVHTIHISLTVSVLTLLYSHLTTFHLHWPCLRDKNSEYGLEGTCTTVGRAITAGRRALMFLRGMRELGFFSSLSVGLENTAQTSYISKSLSQPFSMTLQ